jgi:group II intron reverse transcriptase/maturase
MYLLSEDFLASCFRELKKTASPGVDGKTWDDLQGDISHHITRMVGWLKQGQYWPQPVRRVYIPKDANSMRPLGIPAIGDKILQLAMTKILMSIFEATFLPMSYGYRPNRGALKALENLNECLFREPVSAVIDADIKGFFDSVSHEKLMECLKTRVGDIRFLKLVERFLKAGVMEEGQYTETVKGTPQGGILSPVLSNIFLHYALDRWFVEKIQPNLSGKAWIFRYADDFVICVENSGDAELLLDAIRERFSKCDLELSEEKTRIIAFGRKAWAQWRKGGKKLETFDFLGFTHYTGKSRKGGYKVGRTTSKKKLRQALSSMKIWLKGVRNLTISDWWVLLKAKLRGHYQYYGVTGNSVGINRYNQRVRQLLYKALSRRSQRKSITWGKFIKYLKCHPLPKPSIIHKWYTIPATQ